MTTSRALYVYAAVPRPVSLADVLGVGDQPVEVVAAAGIGLVVSDVDLSLLSAVNEGGAATGLGDLARRHDSVVREAAAVATSVLPFRLGTVVPDREAAHRLLAERAGVLEPALRHVETCWEWGVTARQSPDPAEKKAAAPAPAQTGAAYLARRRQELTDAEELRRRRALAGAEVATELRANAVDATSRAAANALFSESYLVRRESEPAFFEALERCDDRVGELGFRLELSGPWPPYSFVPGRAWESGRE